MTIERTSHGATRAARLEDGRVIYVTLDWDDDGRPFEVFVRLDDPKLFEWMIVVTRFISMAMREDVPLGLIIDELEQIESPDTRHHVPGTNEISPSLAARIGREIRILYETGFPAQLMTEGE